MGLQVIKPDTNIDFIGFKKIAFILSAIIILAGVGSLALKGGPKYGIDFAGGMIVQVKIDKAQDIKEVKDAMKGVELPGLVIQTLGLEGDHEYLIRTSSSDISSQEVRGKVSEALSSNLGATGFEIQRLEMVGPKVGADLRTKALEALFYAVLIIAVYISGRFEQRWTAAGIMAAALGFSIYGIGMLGFDMGFLIVAAMVITVGLCWYLKLNYALGAVAALIHDVMITVGIFSILGKEFDLTIIAALLTIIGYSLNDTIIVFDRIRENNIARKGSDSFGKVINRSINQTLSRTIMTSLTTLLVVACLYVLGGAVIHDFALALLIGVVVGTYSSIFVASPILLGFGPGCEAVKETEA
ncbi:protein translocase subunit SecF [Pseudodesulfovibrio sp. zrk46]|uniref:protein translocase subunit SecF n=1 Tax=Pseudodesulfovibrio sp. zrk46 TaxID=2725288 RepID=UPI001448B882|nr:protein translocase subunit SecF [Pseudodesulfovibrio sp. zrk46]QJB57707.1 protein translocase subunit SecF [Pseudodesulfovibrio sp. zrk46]